MERPQDFAQNTLFTYWERQGIAGVYAKGITSYRTDQADVQNGVLDYKALIVELNFVAGTYIGAIQIPTAATHDVVVDGFTPGGPTSCHLGPNDSDVVAAVER